MSINTQQIAALLARWAVAVEPFWYARADEPEFGCYGPGYIHWGVQSNFNYAAAMATLADQPGVDDPDHWRSRALSALRFALASHHSGNRNGLNGGRWGHSWISMLGIERAMHGVHRLAPYITAEDRAALRRVLISEADWLLHHGHRGGHRDVIADLWNSSGRNAPESNIWAGALLWRTAQMFPAEAAAPDWEERAHAYFINGVSVPADAADDTIVAGKSVRERHVGANFFPNYALDHHGYLNVGYMAICVSNAAMLHFDMRQLGLARPDSLDHHQRDLWAVLRRFLFPDGRLARIGGDSRVRYSYCQEYLLPSLLYAADCWGDPHALELAQRQIDLIQQEMDASPDSTFYGRRLGWMREANPHYFTRLESDRACVLAMALNYAPLVVAPPPSTESFEASVAGSWLEAEHGAAMHRSATRLASFSWRAYGLTQAMCQPPAHSDLAEWQFNLCPRVRFLGDDGSQPGRHRRLLRQQTESFDGGFVTCGAVMEGVDIRVDEGANCTDQAITHIAFAALPDNHTCLALHRVVAAPDRVGYTVEVKSLHLNLPNDLFNGFQRRIHTQTGTHVLSSPVAAAGRIDLNGPWLNVDDKIGLVLLGGGNRFVIDRAPQRRGGRYASLLVDEICMEVEAQTLRRAPGEPLCDAGFAVISGVDARVTATLTGDAFIFEPADVRGVSILGQNGIRYALIANFGEEDATIEVFGKRILLAAGRAQVATEIAHHRRGSLL
ncbi:MAG: hypothetical protein KF893_12010 [Caldilineaceae bacterium]|nr:hypothetical protein [Caldilineaceae bacterium]